MTDLSPLTDTELSCRIGAAVLDHSPELPTLEAERQRRLTATAHQHLADAEARRRQQDADLAERDALLDKLIAMRADYRGRFVALLGELDVAPDKGALVARAYELGRQAYALSHDLAGATGDRQRFEMRYDVPDQLVLHGGRAAEAFLAGLRGRPPVVPTPWRADVERLRVLSPRAERIGNGG